MSDATRRALLLLEVERVRQTSEEGWTTEHDAEHACGELSAAAACYATPTGLRYLAKDGTPTVWPWASSWWKPTPDDRERELVKAGALILAELERIHAARKPGVPS